MDETPWQVSRANTVFGGLPTQQRDDHPQQHQTASKYRAPVQRVSRMSSEIVSPTRYPTWAALAEDWRIRLSFVVVQLCCWRTKPEVPQWEVSHWIWFNTTSMNKKEGVHYLSWTDPTLPKFKKLILKRNFISVKWNLLPFEFPLWSVWSNTSAKGGLKGTLHQQESNPQKSRQFLPGSQLVKGQIKYQHYFQPLKISFLKSSFKC